MTHKERAKQIIEEWFKSGSSIDVYPFEGALEKALREVERETIEKCAKLCEEKSLSHKPVSEWGKGYWNAMGIAAGLLRALKSGGGK